MGYPGLGRLSSLFLAQFFSETFYLRLLRPCQFWHHQTDVAITAQEHHCRTRLGVLHLLAGFFFASIFGHTLCLRAESPLSQESAKPDWRKSLRNLALRNILFKLTDRFLYIGIQNRLFFKHFGVSDNKLIFTPYCVDNDRFQNDAKKLLSKKNKLRTELGLPADSFIALFSGKFIAKKRPLDLLNAVSKIQNEGVYAVFVGDGELRRDMENFIRENNLERRALLTGFVNQSVIPRYYAAADVFVMCSEKGETWGLSTNEAMNFSLPIILSDQLGCADDLVIEGKNGFKYSCGDTSDLAEKIEYLATIPEAQRHDMGVVSLKKVGAYSYSAIIAGLQKI